MLSFYRIVILIAFVLFVVSLVYIGMLLQAMNKENEFPAYASQCPDGWYIDTNNSCTVPDTNHTNYPLNPQQLASDTFNGTDKLYNTSFSGSSYSGKSILFNNNATRCDKRAWAKSAGVSWDGVSNYNKC